MGRIAGILLAGLLLTGAAWWVPSERAYACSCAASQTDRQYAADAGVVFTGRLVQDRVSVWASKRTITFTVDEVFKGEATTTQVVTTHSSGASCGLEIGGPGQFLVLADHDPQEPGSLTADLCGGTRAGGAPASLGQGRPPLSGPTSTNLSLRLAEAISLGLTALLTGGVIGFLIGRHRRSTRARASAADRP